MSQKSKKKHCYWDATVNHVFSLDDFYPVSVQMASMDEFIGAEVAFSKVTNNKIIVKLLHKDARTFVQLATGKAYTTIILQEDDPLLSAIMIKFKVREEH